MDSDIDTFLPSDTQEELYCYPHQLQQQLIDSPQGEATDFTTTSADYEIDDTNLATDFSVFEVGVDETDSFLKIQTDTATIQPFEPTPPCRPLIDQTSNETSTQHCANRKRFIEIRDNLFQSIPTDADDILDIVEEWGDSEFPGHDHPPELHEAVQQALSASFSEWKKSMPHQYAKYLQFCDNQMLESMYTSGFFHAEGIHPPHFKAGVPAKKKKAERIEESKELKKKRTKWVSISDQE